MANGTWTAAERLNVQNMVEQMGMDASIMRQYRYDPVTFNALKENQVAMVTPIEGKEKDDKLTVHWVEHAKDGTMPEDCTTDCDFTGEEAGAYSKEYDLTNCVSYNFSVKESTFRSSYFGQEETLAKLFLTATLEIRKQLNIEAINFLNSNFFTSNYAPSGWTNDATGITVPAAEFNPSLFSQLVPIGSRNQMRDFLIIGGLGMHPMTWEAAMQTDAESRNKLGTQKVPYLDIDQLDVTLNTGMPTFLVDPSAYAIGMKNRYDVGELVDRGYEGKVHYSIPDPVLEGVRYDVSERKSCDTKHDDIIHYSVEAKVEHFISPSSVRDTSNTGIIKLLKG